MSYWDDALALEAGLWVSLIFGVLFGMTIHWAFNKAL